MEVLIIIFVTGLFALFASFAKKPALVFTIATGGLLLALAAMISHFYSETGKWLVEFSYEGLEFDLGFMIFGTVLIVFALLLLTVGYERFKEHVNHTGEYMALLLFSLCGALIMVSFTDMFMFFLGLEIMSIPIYVMAGSNKSDVRSAEASLKYFLTGSFATGILLFGIAWVYAATGSFSLAEIQRSVMQMETPSGMLLIGILLIMASFIFKVGAAPFHFWSPDVYDGAPHSVTGFMASVVKMAAFAAFLKMFLIAFGSEEITAFWSAAIAVLAVITMFVGNLSALRQVRFKRLLAYSSITHVGYTLMVMLTQNGTDLWFYLTAYGFAVITLITVALVMNDNEDRIEAFRGLGKRNPFLAIVAVVAMLSLAGVPPTAGFFGKYMVFSHAWNDWWWLVIIALINSAISIYYYLRIIGLIVDREGEGETEKIALSIPVIAVLILCLVATFALIAVPMF